MNKKIRKDMLLPENLVSRIDLYSRNMGLNFTATCILLLNEILDCKDKNNIIA